MLHNMAARTYRLSPRAEDDLERIWLYTLQNWSLAQADRYHGTLVAEIEALAVGTRSGRRSSIRTDLLKRACGSHIIWYRALPDRLEIIRILHSAQDVERHLHD